jgi:molybdate transport system regulatory protein
VLLTVIWTISGARRGVGKTYLAKHLCAVLPSSIYAKCGHGEPKRGKSDHFFNREEDLEAFVDEHSATCEHVVIEANTYNKNLGGDINIFLEARATATDLRPDVGELRKNANICVCRGESRSKWKAELDKHLSNPALIGSALDVLAEQQRWLSSSWLGIRSKIWFVNAEGEHVFGAGLAQLLVEVEHLGSLEAAAQQISVSYQHARTAIQDAENHFGQRLIRSGSEKAAGEGFTLTKAGKKLVAVYLKLNEKAAVYIDDNFAEAFDRELSELKKLEDPTGLET